MSAPSNRELQRQLREIEERVTRRLNMIEANMLFRINSVQQRLNRQPVFFNDHRLGFGREQVPPPRFSFGPSTSSANWHGLGAVQYRNVTGVVNAPQDAFAAGPMGGFGAIQDMRNALEGRQREARAQRQAAEAIVQEWVGAEQQQEVNGGFAPEMRRES